MDVRTCVLLDSQSTVHAFCNSDLVTDVWEVPEVMTLIGNGGKISTRKQCRILNFEKNRVYGFIKIISPMFYPWLC